MYATKRRLTVLHRKGQLKARSDLPRKTPGARRARFAQLEAERQQAEEQAAQAKAKDIAQGAT